MKKWFSIILKNSEDVRKFKDINKNCDEGAGSRVKEVGLTFVDKMKIAIGIAKGIRYMHEECPRGPVAHGDLKPHNIILGHHLNPQVIYI